MSKRKAIFAIGLASLLTPSIVTAAESPKLEADWYGIVKLDAAYDQNLTSHGNFVMYVQPQVYGKDDEQYNMTANETRLGVNVKGQNYEAWDVGAKVEFDLYAGVTGGSVPENRPMVQLRHAYFSIQRNQTRLLAGQTWDMVSPLTPGTLNYSVLWGCGNIGYRRPQVSLWQTVPIAGNTTVTAAGGFFRMIGSDLTPTFSLVTDETTEGADDGTDAGIPSMQALLDATYKSPGGTQVRFGLSGLWGRLKAETSLGKSERYESWGTAAHLRIEFPGSFGVQGEAYTGNNLGSYMGAITRNSQVDGLKSSGGWGTAFAQVSSKVNLSTGVGIDDPDDKDIADDRSKNMAYFGTVRYTIVPQVTLGLELSQWETQYKDAEDVSSFRMQAAFILNY